VESIAAQKLKLFSLETKWTTRFQHVPEAQGNSRSELYTFSGDFAIFSHPHFSYSLMFHVILPVKKNATVPTSFQHPSPSITNNVTKAIVNLNFTMATFLTINPDGWLPSLLYN
jgi:hypothetical protein